MPSCDFGGPCDCRECSEMRHDRIKKCEYCDEKVDIIIDKWERDRKGISDYYSYGYCKKHNPNNKNDDNIYKMSTTLDIDKIMDISEEEPKYHFGYCERSKKAYKTYHAFDKESDKPLCKLISIYSISEYFRPSKHVICKKCFKKMDNT